MNQLLNWLLGGRDVNAPVEEGIPDWTSSDPLGTSAQAKKKRDYLAEKMRMDQAQTAVDSLRAKAESQGNPDMVTGGGGGSPGIGSLPQIVTPGNNWGTALAQGAQGYMAGQRQKGLDAERSAWEEEMRRAAEESAREYASTAGGATANPTAGAAPAQALPLATRGGSDSLAERQAMQQVYGDFQDTTDSLYPAPVEPATGLSGEGIQLSPEDFQNNTSGGFQPMSGDMGAPAAPAQQGDPRFMAAFNMAMNPLSQDIGMSMMRQVTGGGGDPTAQMKNLMFYNSLPKEQQPMFLNMVRDQQMNLGSGFLNQATGQFTPKGFTPEGWASVRSKAIDDNSSDQKISAFLAAAGGDQQRAYQMQQQAIEQQLMETVNRATSQPNPGQMPPQALPRAAAPTEQVVQGVDGTPAELQQMSQMRQQGMPDSQIAAEMTRRARALPQAVGANAPLPAAPTGGVLVGPDAMAASKKLAEGRAAREVDLEASYTADTANIEAARNNVKMLDQMLANASENTNALSAGFIGDVSKGVGGTPAADLAADIESITSGLAFQKLQELKSLSPSGASGLGQLAIKEFEALSAVLGSLKQNQSPSQLRTKIEAIRGHIRVINDLTERAHIQKYERLNSRGGVPQSGPKRYRLKAPGLDPKLKSSYEEY